MTKCMSLDYNTLISYAERMSVMSDKHLPQGAPGVPPEENRPRPHRRRRIRWVRRLIRLVLWAVIALAVVLGYNYYKEKAFDAANIISTKEELSDTVVKRKLLSIGELATYAYEYEDIREVKSSKQLGNWNIPGTTHTIRIKYNGIIKVGYQVADIGVKVDNDAMVIHVTLPEPMVTDNYIDMDRLEYSEQNNIFNPISGEELTEELEDIKNAELEKAESDGIYELAQGNAKVLINGLLSDFSDFTVKFD